MSRSLGPTLQSLAADFARQRSALEAQSYADAQAVPEQKRPRAQVESILEPIVAALTAQTSAAGFRKAAREAADAMRPLLAELPGPGDSGASAVTNDAFRLRGMLETIAARRGPIDLPDFDVLFRCAHQTNDQISPGEGRALNELAGWMLERTKDAKARAALAAELSAAVSWPRDIPADRFELLERTLARASLQAISDSVDPKGRFALALAEEIAGLKESIGFVDFGSTTGPYQAALEAELAGFRCRGGTASERAAMANVAKQRAAALDRFIDEQEMPRKPCDFYSHFHYTVEQALESVLGVKKTSSW